MSIVVKLAKYFILFLFVGTIFLIIVTQAQRSREQWDVCSEYVPIIKPTIKEFGANNVILGGNGNRLWTGLNRIRYDVFSTPSDIWLISVDEAEAKFAYEEKIVDSRDMSDHSIRCQFSIELNDHRNKPRDPNPLVESADFDKTWRIDSYVEYILQPEDSYVKSDNQINAKFNASINNGSEHSEKYEIFTNVRQYLSDKQAIEAITRQPIYMSEEFSPAILVPLVNYREACEGNLCRFLGQYNEYTVYVEIFPKESFTTDKLLLNKKDWEYLVNLIVEKLIIATSKT